LISWCKIRGNSGEFGEIRHFPLQSHAAAESPSKAIAYQLMVFRDSLKTNIGTDAYWKLLSYARLNIVPNIKLGISAQNGKRF